MKRNLKLLLLLCVCIPCIACHHAEATADPTPPPTPIGHVLIYTDNSPGSLVMASAMNHVKRKRGYATRVTTTEADFIARLPEQAWTSVVVTTKFTSTTPGYRNALVQYVNNGGIALIETWKDNASQPTQANQVLAPSAIQFWGGGCTARGYSALGQNAPELESPVAGYLLCDFEGISGNIMTEISEPDCSALVAGEYPPLAAVAATQPPTIDEIKEEFDEAVERAEALLIKDRKTCHNIYDADPEASPPKEGDPAGLADCLAAAGERYSARMKLAKDTYELRKKEVEERQGATPAA